MTRQLAAGEPVLPPPTPSSESPVKRTHSNTEDDNEPHLPQSQKRTKVVLSASQKSAVLESPLTPSQKRTKIIEAVLKGSPIPKFDKSEAPPRRPISSLSPSLSDDLALLDQTADSGSDLAVGSQHQVPSQDLRSDFLKIEDVALSQQRQACSSQTVAGSDNVNGDTSLVNEEEQRFGVADAHESCWIPQMLERKRSADLGAESSRFERLHSLSPSPLQGTKGKQKATAYGDTPLLVGDRTKVFVSRFAFAALSISDINTDAL